MEQKTEHVLEGNPHQPLIDLLSDSSPLEHWDIYRLIDLQDHIKSLWIELDEALYGPEES